MLLNIVIICVVLQTFAVLAIAINTYFMTKGVLLTARTVVDFIGKFEIMNLGMLPQGIDDDFINELTGNLSDDDETKQ